jgi:hypothetical protein
MNGTRERGESITLLERKKGKIKKKSNRMG